MYLVQQRIVSSIAMPANHITAVRKLFESGQFNLNRFEVREVKFDNLLRNNLRREISMAVLTKFCLRVTIYHAVTLALRFVYRSEASTAQLLLYNIGRVRSANFSHGDSWSLSTWEERGYKIFARDSDKAV